MEMIINTDGACRGNPGPSSYAFIIKSKDGVILHQEGGFLGKSTNNLAEYSAVFQAFCYIKKHLSHKAPHKVEVLTDSQLMAQQLMGRYKVKNEGIRDIFERVKMLEGELGEVNYKYVPRAQNFIADKLANQVLDKETDARV